MAVTIALSLVYQRGLKLPWFTINRQLIFILCSDCASNVKRAGPKRLANERLSLVKKEKLFASTRPLVFIGLVLERTPHWKPIALVLRLPVKKHRTVQPGVLPFVRGTAGSESNPTAKVRLFGP